MVSLLVYMLRWIQAKSCQIRGGHTFQPSHWTAREHLCSHHFPFCICSFTCGLREPFCQTGCRRVATMAGALWKCFNNSHFNIRDSCVVKTRQGAVFVLRLYRLVAARAAGASSFPPFSSTLPVALKDVSKGIQNVPLGGPFFLPVNQ